MAIRTVAVIGAGRMGGGIARTLARSGSFKVHVFDTNGKATESCVDLGAQAFDSVKECVSDADLVITSLPMPDTVIAIFRSYLECSPSRAIWMDVSTIDPQTARLLDDLAADGGRKYVACSLGKGPAQAEEGTLPLFVGCENALLPELKDVFDCIGENVHYFGSPAAATAFKIVSNLVGMTNLAVLAEGYTMCKKFGTSDESFVSALRDTGAWSYQAELRLPWMINGDFENRFGVDLAIKDVRLAVDAAAHSGISVPVGAAGLMQLVQASSRGWGREDVDAVVKVVDPEKKQ
jgi:3-hydroxyisobutyrate dehydrogenase